MLTVRFCINHLHFNVTPLYICIYLQYHCGQYYNANASNCLKINSLGRKDFKAFKKCDICHSLRWKANMSSLCKHLGSGAICQWHHSSSA